MQPRTETEPTGQTPINQNAILVDADKLSDLLKEMGPDAINQRFTGTSGRSREAVPTDPDEYHDYIENMRGPVSAGPKAPSEPAGIIDMPAPEVQESAPRPAAYITEVPGLVTSEAAQPEVKTEEDPYAVGKTVSVYRSKKAGGGIGGGWKIIERMDVTLPNGDKVPSAKVEQPRGSQFAEKIVTIEELKDIERQLSEAQPTEEPSGDEVDSNAHMYTPAELKKMVADARALAESSGSDATSQEPETVTTDPFDALPKDVQDEVSRYRAAVQSKAAAESVKNYAGAADAGRDIYDIGKSISPAAQAFVDFRR